MNESLEYIKQAFELKTEKCYKQAIEMLYKALELENDNIEILFQLGELYFLLKNFQRASHYLEKVLSQNENHVEALVLTEKIAEYSQDLPKAFCIAEKIFKLENNKKSLIELIKISSKKGDLKKIREFSDSEDEQVVYEIAKAFYDNKLPNEAQEKLEKFKNTENEDILILLGKIYFDKSEFDKSKEIFSKFSINSENPEALNYIGLFALEDMKFLDAIKCFSKAFSIDKNNAKYSYNLGNAYFYNGWIKEAAASYLQAIKLDPENLGYRYSLAYLYYEQKSFEKAQKEVDYILEYNTDYPQGHVLNALLKFENRDYLGAKNELETNLKAGNNDNFTLVSLSKVYSELAMFDKAETTIKEALEKNPKSLNYQCQMAEIQIAEGKYDDAIKIIEDIILKNENYIYAYVIGAKASCAKGDYVSAKNYAQNAISLDMNYGAGYYYLGVVRFEEKDYEEAIECLKRAITYDIDNPNYYAKMSEIYEAKKDYKTALEYIKEAESITNSTEYRIKYKNLAELSRKI